MRGFVNDRVKKMKYAPPQGGGAVRVPVGGGQPMIPKSVIPINPTPGDFTPGGPGSIDRKPINVGDVITPGDPGSYLPMDPTAPGGIGTIDPGWQQVPTDPAELDAMLREKAAMGAKDGSMAGDGRLEGSAGSQMGGGEPDVTMLLREMMRREGRPTAQGSVSSIARLFGGARG